MNDKLSVRLARTALMLALILAIQLLKNISPYISGPLVNTVLIITTLLVGPISGIALSIIAPVSSFFITGSPLITATHFTLFPVIMGGNIIIVLGAYLGRKSYKSSAVGLAVGSVLKWLFMWGGVALVITPLFSHLGESILSKLAQMFTHLQLYASLSGSLLALLILPIIRKAIK